MLCVLYLGGPVIDMKYGRKDAETPACCVDEGNLPAGNAPFPDADTPQVWLVETPPPCLFFFASRMTCVLRFVLCNDLHAHVYWWHVVPRLWARKRVGIDGCTVKEHSR